MGTNSSRSRQETDDETRKDAPGAIDSVERSESTPSPTGTVEPDTGTQSLQRADSGHDWGSPFEVGGGATSTQVGPGGSGPTTDSQYEHHYGVELSAPGEAATLQRLEEANGLDTVRSWANEGMPVQAMGTPSKMQRFRDRKGSPVPWNAEEKNAQSLQRSTKAAENTSPAGETSVPDSVRSVLSSPGKQLDGTIQRAMEDRMGDSFSDVQIHTGPQAAKACDDINARAFTVGNNIAFNQGEYDPSSPESQHVIAHELAHVRQQTGGDVSMLPQEDVQMEVDPDPKLEKEAEKTAQRVMSGGELGIQRMSKTEVHVQRASDIGPHNNIQEAVQAGYYDDATDEELDELLERIAAGSQEAGETFLNRLIPGEITSFIEGYRNKGKEQSGEFEQKIQQTLPKVEFPQNWLDTIENWGPPPSWEDKLSGEGGGDVDEGDETGEGISSEDYN